MDPWEWGLCGPFLGPSMLCPSLIALPPAVGNISAPPCCLLQITPACFTDSCVGAHQWGLHFKNHSGASAARLSYFSWTAETQRFLDPWCCPGRCWKVESPTHLPTRGLKHWPSSLPAPMNRTTPTGRPLLSSENPGSSGTRILPGCLLLGTGLISIIDVLLAHTDKHMSEFTHSVHFPEEAVAFLLQ